MTKLFGTDGMRGEAGIFPLDAATVETVGDSLATHLKNKLGRRPLLVVGRDTRESGEWLEQALAVGAAKAGAQLKSAGVITTPGVAFLARTLPADAGIVISASHNAYSDNGVKIFAPSGRKLDEATERLIERDVFAELDRRASATGAQFGTTSSATPVLSDSVRDLRVRYVDFLVKDIGRDMDLKGINLLLDCANGAASDFAAEVFERLGASVRTINDSPDGRNINFRSGSLHMEGVRHEVLNQNADLGVAFDGDADRSLFVDATGRLINGDASLWILARYMHARHQLDHQTVVATVMSNIGLEIALKSEGLQLVRTDVGDKYVLEELLRLGASLGGEQSGHIIFPNLSLAGDGLITTLCVLRAMTEERKALHELTEGFKSFPQILVNVAVKAKRPFAEVSTIQKAARDIEADLGLRGRLLLRYSGTESLARVMIEGENQDEIEKHANQLASVIEASLGA
jgi:phosphoglucosamine mutase